MLLAGRRISVLICAMLILSSVFAPTAFAAKPNAVTLDPVIADSGVTLKGAVLSDGGEAVSETGFYYGVSRSKLDQKATAGSSQNPEVTLTNLEPLTVYYVQAYAKNASGEGSGNVIAFKTLSKNGAKPTEQPVRRSGEEPESVEAYAEKIKSEFGIQIHYKGKRSEWNHLLTYKPVSGDAEAMQGLKLIYNGLSKYPDGFLSKLKLKYIALASDITTKDGDTATGVALGNTQQTMLLIQATTKESVMHHELFHAYEYAFGLRFGDWDKANVKTGLYDKGLKKSYDLLPPGFVTRYAMTMPEEDRADVFMYMMTDGLREQLVDTAAHDAYLMDKVKRLNASLETNLGKIAQNSRWSTCAASVSKANVKALGSVSAVGAAKLYIAPDSQTFSPAKEVPDGTRLDVVQAGARWYKVMTGGESFYVQTAAVSALSTPSSGTASSNSSASGASNPDNQAPRKNSAALDKRMYDNYGITVSVVEERTSFGAFTAGAVRDLSGAVNLVAEYEALMQSGEKALGGVTNIVVCRTLRSGTTPLPAVLENGVLYLSQEIPLGSLKGVMAELASQY